MSQPRQPKQPASRVPVPPARQVPAPAAAMRPPRPERPLGVTLIALLNFVVAGLLLVLMFVSVVNTESGNFSLACVAILPLAISLGVGVGLWQMLPWAANTAILVYAFYGLSALLNILSRPPTWNDVASLLIPVVLVAYLLQPAVRATFDANKPK